MGLTSIDELESDMNHWLDGHSDFHVINVETVVLPMKEMHKDLAEEKFDTAKLSTYGYYVQFIRVWYKIDVDGLLRDAESINIRFQLRYFLKYCVRKPRQNPAMPAFSVETSNRLYFKKSLCRKSDIY